MARIKKKDCSARAVGIESVDIPIPLEPRADSIHLLLDQPGILGRP